jgi:hypothetical protein
MLSCSVLFLNGSFILPIMEYCHSFKGKTMTEHEGHQRYKNTHTIPLSLSFSSPLFHSHICYLYLVSSTHQEIIQQIHSKDKQTTVKMCETIITYDCGHIEITYRECLKAKECRQQIKRQKAKQTGIWKSLFCKKQKGPEVICTAKPGQQRIQGKCSECMDAKDEDRRLAEWRERERRKTKAAVAVIDQGVHERRRQDTKWTWLCKDCRKEERVVERYHREVNGGPCCANGVDEFDAWQRREGYHSVDSRLPSQKRPKRHRETRPTREDYSPPPPAHLKKDRSYAPAKLEADIAAKNYGFRRDNDQNSNLSPKEVAMFVSMPGTDPRSLPPPPPEPQPYCMDAGIQPKRWYEQRRTNHGSYPAPSPPPTDPLPVQPLQLPLRRVSGQADLKNPVATPRGSYSAQMKVKAASMSGPVRPSTPPRIPAPFSSFSGPPGAPRKLAQALMLTLSTPTTPSKGSRTSGPSKPARKPAAPSSSSRPTTSTSKRPRSPSRPEAIISPERDRRMIPNRGPIRPTAPLLDMDDIVSHSSHLSHSSHSSSEPITVIGPSRPTTSTSTSARSPSRPKAIVPAKWRRTSYRGPPIQTDPVLFDEYDISPPSSPISDASPVSPASSAVDEMTRQLNSSIDDTMEYYTDMI